ncbi:hypothetical protein AB0J55_27800 [Amycolatopsis sp. NPDC049688]|uniref:hypothetical protein n=1 Tax=Amycolatopsis sp. NPDC049688 TaxID=3154733 RepID=UPI0034182755
MREFLHRGRRGPIHRFESVALHQSRPRLFAAERRTNAGPGRNPTAFGERSANAPNNALRPYSGYIATRTKDVTGMGIRDQLEIAAQVLTCLDLAVKFGSASTRLWRTRRRKRARQRS